MKKLLITVFLIFLTSCSFSGRNFVKVDRFSFNGGTSNSLEWKDRLEFKRASWFLDMTMMFDVYMARLDSRSPFFTWLSTAEKDLVRDCRELYFTMSYNLDSEKMSQRSFLTQMEDLGFEQILSTNFKLYIKSHPQYLENSLHLYKSYFLCSKKSLQDRIIIRYPNYKEAYLY